MDVTYRRATRDDVPVVVRLLADDPLGMGRERDTDPLPDAYWRAFEAIDADPRQWLIVAELDGRVVGTLQLSFIPSLTLTGSERLQIEGVRVDSSSRGTGIGRRMIEWALEEGRARGCALAQLTTNKRRVDAHRFYESLGFEATHEGMKRAL